MEIQDTLLKRLKSIGLATALGMGIAQCGLASGVTNWIGPGSDLSNDGNWDNFAPDSNNDGTSPSTAVFTNSFPTTANTNGNMSLANLKFSPGAASYTLRFLNGANVLISGGVGNGITNNSSVTQSIHVDAGAVLQTTLHNSNPGDILIQNAGTLTLNADRSLIENSGTLNFNAAGIASATVTNTGTININDVTFITTTPGSLAAAHITNDFQLNLNGHTSGENAVVLNNAVMQFAGSSTGGNAQIQNAAGSQISLRD
jgi:hypothetical protein